MKKRLIIVASVVLFLLVIFSAIAETVKVPIDLKSMSIDDLMLLSDEITKEIGVRMNNDDADECLKDKGDETQAETVMDATTDDSAKPQVSGKKVILDQNSILIYIDGKARIEETWVGVTKCSALVIPVIIENNSSYTINPTLEDVSVNGWSTNGGNDVASIGGVRYGTKSRNNLKFNLDKTDIRSIKDFSSAEFVFEVYNTDDWMGKKVIERSKQAKILAEDIQ